MLKTCLFVLHKRLSDPTVELLPEQWAVMIYKQLLQFVFKGRLPIMFDLTYGKDHSVLFDCEHDIDEMQEHDELRAACCDTKINLMIIAEHLYNILVRYCQLKGINVDGTTRLLRYDHNAGLIE